MNDDAQNNLRILRACSAAVHGTAVSDEIDPVLQQLSAEIALIMAAPVDPTRDTPDAMRGVAEALA